MSNFILRAVTTPELIVRLDFLRKDSVSQPQSIDAIQCELILRRDRRIKRLEDEIAALREVNTERIMVNRQFAKLHAVPDSTVMDSDVSQYMDDANYPLEEDTENLP